MDKTQIKEFIPDKYNNLQDFWEKSYPADKAEFLNRLSPEMLKDVIDIIDYLSLGEIIRDLDYKTSYYIAEKFDSDKLSKILTTMYADDAADFLGKMPVGKVKDTLNKLKTDQAKELQRLLGYSEETAGGLMNTQFIVFYQDNTVQQVLEKLRRIISEPEMIYYIYIITRTKKLKGVLSVRQLLSSEPDQIIKDIMSKDVIKVYVNMDQEDVADVLNKYDLLAVPVVNKNEQMLGIITIDDILEVIENEATEDIYKMAATTNVYDVKGGLLSIIKKRLPWLLILLVGDMMSGSVIQSFEESLKAVVALAFFIPVLMDMGGNVGTQSLAVVVRGLATNKLYLSDYFSHVYREIKVGLIMALILGGSIGSIVLLWQGDAILGIVVGVSMFVTLLTAIFVGTSVPFVMDGLGIDPAIASGPFITTIVDVTGLFIYFYMASLLINNFL
ncbi:MAG: magnesium transporter [Halanaerobiales bacterium]|nr:magnesium transporter [Halanaerobiales bacterium]